MNENTRSCIQPSIVQNSNFMAFGYSQGTNSRFTSFENNLKEYHSSNGYARNPLLADIITAFIEQLEQRLCLPKSE